MQGCELPSVLDTLIQEGRRLTVSQWDIKGDHLLVGTCKDKSGKEVRSQAALELCLRYDNGALIPADK